MQIGIIGAGAAGMAAAWDLVSAGHDVTLFEAGAEVGGLAAGFKEPEWDWTLEKFYHHWFETDADILKLVGELGKSDKLMFPRPKTSYWLDGQIVRSEMTPQSVLFALPLSLPAKIRLAFGGGLLKYLTRDWRGLEKVTADTWLRRVMGKEAYERLWRPLLIGKFSDRYTRVNMAWLWARIITRSVRLGIYQGGFQAFLNDLAAALTAKGAHLLLNAPVEHIGTQGGKPTLTVKGETHVFDRVLSTVSPGLMLKMADGLANTPYGQQTAALESIGALCVVFALKQSLLVDGTYWLNLPAASPDKQKNPFPFLALVEHTNWMDKAHYNGDVLVYCGDYVPVDHAYFRLSDAELADRFAAVLPQFNPAFQPDWIRKSWVWRAPYAQPVPGVNHSARIPDVRTPLPGVFWASMSHVYPYDRGTNYAVRLGRETAAKMQA
ncbi:MAG: NAD(P)/FAD-dependent oxidoreductase [bacterium]|nr:NAD(P)/FAD-dependent oxidoreductase [bacterium]